MKRLPLDWTERHGLKTPGTEFFLFLGNAASESSTHRLKAAQTLYVWKRLESGPDNWRKILAHLESPKLLGALVQLTSANIDWMLHGWYKALAESLFQALAKSRSIVFIHESILAPPDAQPSVGEVTPTEPPIERIGGFDPYRHWDPAEYFSPPDEEALAFVRDQLRLNDITVMPYKTNAELSVLAWQFIERIDKHLLFRVYIPKGRIWSAEADKLFSLFRDWLGRVKGSRVRQDGYTTPQGQVYEFYGEGGEVGISDQFNEFSEFLDDCLEEPERAIQSLDGRHLNRFEIDELVARYSKEARRLKLDLRQARESRILSLKHRLEADLSEAGLSDIEIAQIADRIVPPLQNYATAITAGPAWRIEAGGPVQVSISNQTIENVYGIAAQQIHGTANLGPEARELLELIDKYGGSRKAELATAVHELEDEDAPAQDRMTARQRLKAFLYGLGGQLAGVGTGLLTAYIEGRLGMG